MKKHDKTEDKIFSEIDLQLANTINDLRALNRKNKDVVLQQSCSSTELFDNAKSKMQNEEREQKLKEEFDKKTAKPRQKVQEAVYLVEHAKHNIRDSKTEEDLFKAGTEYETALKQYQNAFNELAKLDTSTSNQCFDPIPSVNNINERLRFLGTMRGIWKQKEVKK
jgi:hypothetical protein